MIWQIMTTAEVSSKAMIRFILVSVELKDEWYSTDCVAKRSG